MTNKRPQPLNEGYTRDVQKGSVKPQGRADVKPVAPPPPMKPTKKE